MERRDYLKKQMDLLAKALAKMLWGLVEKEQEGQQEEGLEQTRQSLKSELGYTTEELLDIHSSDFIEKLQQEKSISNESLDKLADLFMAIADCTTDTLQRKKLYDKSLTILLYLEESETVYSYDRYLKIERIKNLL